MEKQEGIQSIRKIADALETGEIITLTIFWMGQDREVYSIDFGDLTIVDSLVTYMVRCRANLAANMPITKQ